MIGEIYSKWEKTGPSQENSCICDLDTISTRRSFHVMKQVTRPLDKILFGYDVGKEDFTTWDFQIIPCLRFGASVWILRNIKKVNNCRCLCIPFHF